mgnify:CR=1 FL=1
MVIGNPPYSGESSNKGDWIMDLMDAYKKEPGGKVKLMEKNSKWINDDYVKFIRFAEHMIEKNGEGVLGFITNHGYLDNPTFRGMRRHLLETFDKIYVLDLHGNSKKNEVSPDGSADTNVFDIMPGVAIIVGAKSRKPEKRDTLAKVFHADLWGSRSGKNKSLRSLNCTGGSFQVLEPFAPYYFLTGIKFVDREIYECGFSIKDFFGESNTGIKSHRDEFVVGVDKEELSSRFTGFFDISRSTDEVLRDLNLKETKTWNATDAREGNNFDSEKIHIIYYRPFDSRWIYYDRRLIDRDRFSTMQHILGGENVSLLAPKMTADGFDALATDALVSNKTASRYDQTYCFPLYLYPDEDSLDQNRRVNMDPKIRKQIEKAATPKGGDAPDEVAIFDYIYGVLHCPAYRETYAEFLKIDFPRVPYPPSPEVFADVSEKGGQLRRLHLMQPDAIGDTPYPYMGEGDNIVVKPEHRDGSVWINDIQHFEDVPMIAWDFQIGGYQPARKWLKDRKDRELTLDDVRHYQRIVKILIETDRIMATIELPVG